MVMANNHTYKLYIAEGNGKNSCRHDEIKSMCDHETQWPASHREYISYMKYASGEMTVALPEPNQVAPLAYKLSK